MGISEEKASLRTRYRRERSERYLEHSFEHLADSQEFHKAKVVASHISYACLLYTSDAADERIV